MIKLFARPCNKQMFERSANVFPGSESKIQGLYREVDVAGAVRLHTYVFKESCSWRGFV